ncbi:MAG TPA: type I methionyl aminopeptidase [Clostridiaceae bacterium]|nr:type I methionyl aminopeptidase [Clostridiaceae bacterium]
MIRIKSREEILRMRKPGAVVASVFEAIAPMMRSGISTGDIDRIAHRVIVDAGATPSFLGYGGPEVRPFPAATCISIDEEVVHGIPSDDRFLEDGMVVSVDVGAYLDGFHADAARTYIIGDVPPRVKELVEVTEEAFWKGLEQAFPGNRIGDISAAVQEHCESHGFGIIRVLTGHGVGRELHESPNLPNYGRRGRGLRLQAGMTLALEPMVTLGSYDVVLTSNEWTFVTVDGQPSAHYENSFAITNKGPVVLTV